MQRITLKPFGPIKDVEIDVNDLMIFIGPQASGKSTISKVIHFFKSLRYDLFPYVLEAAEQGATEEPLEGFADLVSKRFLETCVPTRRNWRFFCSYDYGNGAVLSIKKELGYVIPEFSDEFKKRFFSIWDQAREYCKKPGAATSKNLPTDDWFGAYLRHWAFIEALNPRPRDWFNDRREYVFIPATRGVLATLSNQLQSLDMEKLDCLTRTFIDKISYIRHRVRELGLRELVRFEKMVFGPKKVHSTYLTLAEKLIDSILKARYRQDSYGEDLSFGRWTSDRIGIDYASSGQQEAVWILLLIFLLILDRETASIVIEEPEAHLHSEAQLDLVHLIALFCNVSENQAILTTHSPYVLSSLNNLFYAHRVGRNNSSTTGRIVNRKLWLDPARTDAYFVSDGMLVPIKDKDTGFIKSEMVDSASETINRTYEQLFDLDKT
ncbi:MAG: AAA family ATPase [Pseudomonadota bacterium]